MKHNFFLKGFSDVVGITGLSVFVFYGGMFVEHWVSGNGPWEEDMMLAGYYQILLIVIYNFKYYKQLVI